MKKLLNLVIAALFFQSAMAQVTIDRTKPPAAGPAPVIAIKDPYITVLPNGITLLVVENHKLPRVRASLNIDRGPIVEGKKAGVMNLMGQMLEEGTVSRSKADFDEAVDMMGAELNMNSSGGSISSLTRYFDKSFELFSDALRHPSFPQESFDKLKTLTLTNLKSSEKSASVIGGRVTTALSFGKQTALGEFTTEESVKGLTLNDVKDAYKNYITPSRSYLVFVGDITPAAAKTIALKYLGNWTGVTLPVPSVPNTENPAKTEIDFVDVPTAVQGELSVSNLINNPLSNPDYHALVVANNILGGGAEAKLFMNLREKHGFTYGSYSRAGNGRWQAQFKATAAVRTDKVDSAAAEIMNEIVNMREGKATQEELNMVKAKYNGSFALGMEDPANMATYATNILINGLPKDFYKVFLQKINKVTLADVQRVSKQYFSQDNSRIVIVGNAGKILPNLTRLGYPVKMYDRWANPVVEKPNTDVSETKKTTDGISAYSVIENYLKAIGGKEEVKKVTSVKISLTTDIMGQAMEGTTIKMNPTSFYSDLRKGPMVFFKTSFNGLTGYNVERGEKKDFTPEEAKEAIDDKGAVPQLYYNGAEYKTEYMGTEKINGQDAYKLKIIKPSGKLSVEYYSTKTDLLIREESTDKGPQGEVNVTVDYADYKKVGAVSFPYSITRMIGDQFTLDMKVTDIKVNEGVSAADFK